MALTKKPVHDDDDIDSLCNHLGLDPTKYVAFSNDAAPLGTARTTDEHNIPQADKSALPPSSERDGQQPPETRGQEQQKSSGTVPQRTIGSSSRHRPARSRLESSFARVRSSFPRSKFSGTSSPAPANVTPEDAAPRPSNLHVFGLPIANLAGPRTPELPTAPAPAVTRWPSLRGLSGNVVKAVGLNTQPIAFHAVGGGVGLTTVLATTAKAFGTMGKRVLVADDSRRGTLPLFFGARQLPNGMNSIIVPNGVPTYLLLRDTAPETDTSDEWLWSKAAQLDSNIDVLLMEAGPQMAARTQTWVYSRGISIFVLEPDMRSALALRQTLELLAARETRFSGPVPTYFLLNKYDENSLLDVDMRRWLQDELGNMMAPFVLRRDYRVGEAFASGKTVIDYTPNAAISQDFLAFAQWLSSAWQR